MVEFVDSNVEGIPPLCRVIPMIRLPLIKTELDNTTRLENELVSICDISLTRGGTYSIDQPKLRANSGARLGNQHAQTWLTSYYPLWIIID